MHNGLLKALFNPQVWKDSNHAIKKQLFQGDEDGWLIVSTLRRFYDTNPSSVPSVQDVKDYLISVVLAGEKETRRNELTKRIDDIRDSAADESSGSFVAGQLAAQAVLLELGGALSTQVNNPDVTAVVQTLEEAKTKLEKNQEKANQLQLPTPDEFCHTMDAVSKWHWSIRGLDERTQGFGPGRSALIFGLANVGKSSLTLELLKGFMAQGARVLDISINEDPFSRRMPRMLQAITHKPYIEVVQNKRHWYEKFLGKYGEQYRFVYDPATTIHKIKGWVEEFKPDIVVVDNFSKVTRHTKQEVNHAKQLGLILSDLKGLAEEYQFGVIPVCQASDSAQGRQRLTMANIADSRVDVPGELEIAIGVAASESGGSLRYLSLAKNKLGPEEYWAVNFDESTCQWSE